MIAFLLSCLLVYKSYDVVDHYLNYLPYYEKRKLYVQKNVVKSCYLALLSLAATVYFAVYPWDNATLRLLAACYVSNDVVGLYMVRLPTSTKIHHATSGLFLLMTYMVDFETSKAAQLLVYYTYFSALAFPVNLYLGLRLCFELHPDWLVEFRNFCKWWYLALCATNWAVQAYLTSALSLEVGVYTTMILLIVMDDVVLLKWLFQL